MKFKVNPISKYNTISYDIVVEKYKFQNGEITERPLMDYYRNLGITDEMDSIEICHQLARTYQD